MIAGLNSKANALLASSPPMSNMDRLNSRAKENNNNSI